LTVVSKWGANDSLLSSVTPRFLAFCVCEMVELSIEMTRSWQGSFLAAMNGC